MIVPAISPSQISDFAPEYGGCEMYWGFVKIRKVPKPPNRHAQWGLTLHDQAELWLRDGTPPDATTPQGKALLRAIELLLLPAPGTVAVETKISFKLEGVEFHGRRDFGSKLRDPYYSEIMVGDHKSTGSIRRAREGGWMMTPEKMRADPQYLIYGYGSSLDHYADHIRGRWIYYPRDGGLPEAVESVESFDVIENEMHSGILPIARRIVAAYGEPLEERPRNLKACGRFGGCPFKSICLTNVSPAKRFAAMTSTNKSPLDNIREGGGTALQRLKAQMAARAAAAKVEEPPVAKTESPAAAVAEPPAADPMVDAMADELLRLHAATDPRKSTAEPPVAEPPVAEPPVAAEPPKPKRRRGRPPGSKNKPKDTETTPPVGGPSAASADYVDEPETTPVAAEPPAPVAKPAPSMFASELDGVAYGPARLELLLQLHVAAITAHAGPEVANAHYAAILDKIEGEP